MPTEEKPHVCPRFSSTNITISHPSQIIAKIKIKKTTQNKAARVQVTAHSDSMHATENQGEKDNPDCSNSAIFGTETCATHRPPQRDREFPPVAGWSLRNKHGLISEELNVLVLENDTDGSRAPAIAIYENQSKATLSLPAPSSQSSPPWLWRRSSLAPQWERDDPRQSTNTKSFTRISSQTTFTTQAHSELRTD